MEPMVHIGWLAGDKPTIFSAEPLRSKQESHTVARIEIMKHDNKKALLHES